MKRFLVNLNVNFYSFFSILLNLNVFLIPIIFSHFPFVLHPLKDAGPRKSWASPCTLSVAFWRHASPIDEIDGTCVWQELFNGFKRMQKKSFKAAIFFMQFHSNSPCRMGTILGQESDETVFRIQLERFWMPPNNANSFYPNFSFNFPLSVIMRGELNDN